MTRALCQVLLLLAVAAALSAGTSGAPSHAPRRVGVGSGLRGWGGTRVEEEVAPSKLTFHSEEWEAPVGLRERGMGRGVGT